MGNVVSMARERAERQARARVAAERGSLHPALRWIAGEAFWIAHRKAPDGTAACGASGSLVLAPPGVPTCRDCYPAAASGDS